MKSIIFFIAMILSAQKEMPKNDPGGVWESQAGTQYRLELAGGTDLSVSLVPDSTPRYASYEVSLKVSPEEKNTYIGKGFFVAVVKEGKQCRFDTEWQITVVQKDLIVGSATSIVPDPETCAVKESSQAMLNLKRK